MRLNEVFGVLNEMPKRVPDSYGNRYDRPAVREEYLELLPTEMKSQEIVLKNGNFVLYKAYMDHGFDYYGLDTSTEKSTLVYLSQWDSVTIEAEPTLTQVLVWRDKTANVDNKIVQKVMFDVLRDNAAIVSDDSHTNSGIALWKSFVKECFNKGYKVGIVVRDEIVEWVSKERMDFLFNSLWDSDNKSTRIFVETN